MQSNAATVQQYLAQLPDDRRAALSAVREVILKNLGAGYAEGMQYGMIGFFVPHSVFPAGYHCDPSQPLPFAGLASQKNHMAIYLMATYMKPGEEAWLRTAWGKTGKKLDMGKSCIRFKKLEEVPLAVVGEAIRRMPAREYMAMYEAHRPGGAKTTSKAGGAKAAAKATSKAAAKAGPAKAASKAAAKAGAAKATSKAAAKAGAAKSASKAGAKAGAKAAGPRAAAKRATKVTRK